MQERGRQRERQFTVPPATIGELTVAADVLRAHRLEVRYQMRVRRLRGRLGRLWRMCAPHGEPLKIGIAAEAVEI